MKLPRLVHNHLSYAGAAVAVLALLAFLFLVFFHTVTQTIRAPYAGLIIFPEMKARWDVYPDNVGHLVFPGCARCHDGKHRSSDGKVITRDCTACHTILAQGPPPRIRFATAPEGLPFQHPEDVGDVTGDLGCSGCHTGASP